jgi:hypothetical protein
MSLLFEIIVSDRANVERSLPADAPSFVSEMIEAGLSSEAIRLSSFCSTFATLKQNSFGVVAGFGSAAVLSFVGWVELSKQSDD